MTGKKMRIALCLSGEPRSSMFSFPYIYEAFLKDNQLYDIDVYCHSWKGFRALDLYKPKNYKIENINEHLFVESALKTLTTFPTEISTLKDISDNFTPNTSLFKNSILMYSSIKKCFNLVQEPYDVYIRCRYDVFFRNKFWLFPILNDIGHKKYDMFIPLRFAYRSTPLNYNDQIAIGNYFSMKVYTNLIDNLQTIVNNTNVWDPEMWLRYWLDTNKIKINQHFVDYTLVRQSSLVTNEESYTNFLDE
jgi:hypothetical protein